MATAERVVARRAAPGHASRAPKKHAFPHHRWQRIALAASSGALLSLSYVYPFLFVFSWIGFIPLLLAIRNTSARASYAYGVITGLALYVGATHWVTEFIATLKSYGPAPSVALAMVFWIYSAQTIGLIALLFRWLKRALPVPAVLLFPTIVVTVCIASPTLFTTRLGETQSHFLPAIQAIEFTGLYGLDFLIALVNAALYQWLVRDPEAYRRPAAILAGAVVVGWFGYGIHATFSWNQRINAWDTVQIGIVQANEPPSVGIPAPRPGYSRSYPLEMPLTAKLAKAGAEVVVWPETRFKGYFEHDYVRRAYQHELAPLRTPLLLQDMERVYHGGGRQEYNTAAFLNSEGALAGTYRKIQRVAFGEYIPLVGYVPGLQSWVQSYFAFNEVAPGFEPQVFRTAKLALVPLICYEVAFPLLVAESLAGEPQGKVLVTLANDTWFGNTRQPYMHGYTSALRAVENRVPLIHVLNNGPSVVVRPDGRFIFRGDFRETAGYLVDMPYSPTSGGSLFSRYPYWFISTLYALLVMMVLAALTRRAG